MSDWLRRNRWFLVALVVLIPAAVLVSLIPRWFPYQGIQPEYDRVERGDTVEYAGAEFTLTELQLLDGTEWGASAGADIVVATLTVDVIDPQEAGCDIDLVSDAGGLERFWPSAIGDVGDYDIPDEYETLCTFQEAGAYELQVGFEVPAGQVPDADVLVTSSAELPRVLRLN